MKRKYPNIPTSFEHPFGKKTMAKIVQDRDKLPRQQKKVLDYIEEYLEISGYPPAISEICDFLGVSSTFGVRKHLDALIRKGFLMRGGPGLSRAVMVSRPSMNI